MKIDWTAYYFPNEMMEQADAIENCMKALQDQLAAVAQTYREIERMYVVGSGDCYFIGHAAAYAFRNARKKQSAMMPMPMKNGFNLMQNRQKFARVLMNNPYPKSKKTSDSGGFFVARK